MPTQSAYVTQDDALFALSTVRETLLFAAKLRLPKTTTAKEREARVDAVIRSVVRTVAPSGSARPSSPANTTALPCPDGVGHARRDVAPLGNSAW